jgi:hypothetical protein
VGITVTAVAWRSLAFNREEENLGIGQYTHGCCGVPETALSLPAAVAEDTEINLSHSNPGVVSTPDSVTIPAGSSSVKVRVIGAAEGVDIITATGPDGSGYASDTLTVSVGEGTVELYSWPNTTVRVGEVVSAGRLILRCPGGGVESPFVLPRLRRFRSAHPATSCSSMGLVSQCRV